MGLFDCNICGISTLNVCDFCIKRVLKEVAFINMKSGNFPFPLSLVYPVKSAPLNGDPFGVHVKLRTE